jgi:tRNA threonylcarbamoyladenosine biosynthesis protein TsaB
MPGLVPGIHVLGCSKGVDGRDKPGQDDLNDASIFSMLILAIDTALDACAAAVLDTDAARTIAQESHPMKRGHAEALMPLIGRVIKASGIGFADLDRIAVTTGPGSFTGLRVGLSAARGIALAADKPVVGLTTLTAYAAPVVSRNGEPSVVSAIDARHDHVYFQVVSGDGSSLMRPKVAPIEEALAASRFGPCWLVGNAAKILADRWPTDALPPFKVDAQPAPDITWVAWLGAAVSPNTAPARPYYLRAPDAKPQKDMLPNHPQQPVS